jgi:hypothetical protein
VVCSADLVLVESTWTCRRRISQTLWSSESPVTPSNTPTVPCRSALASPLRPKRAAQSRQLALINSSSSRTRRRHTYRLTAEITDVERTEAVRMDAVCRRVPATCIHPRSLFRLPLEYRRLTTAACGGTSHITVAHRPPCNSAACRGELPRQAACCPPIEKPWERGQNGRPHCTRVHCRYQYPSCACVLPPRSLALKPPTYPCTSQGQRLSASRSVSRVSHVHTVAASICSAMPALRRLRLPNRIALNERANVG